MLPDSVAAAGDPVVQIWDVHFRAPEEGLARARRALARPDADPKTRAWAELTQAYDHLAFSANPDAARPWIADAAAAFDGLGDARGRLLAAIASARLMIVEQTPLEAREALLALQPEARSVLPPQDCFWLINSLGATYFYTDQIDEAIRHLYEALETLRSIPLSPQLPTIMSNLAAALCTVGDFVPARELAQEAVDLLANYQNPQVMIYARANLAEALAALGDRAAALATVEAMFEPSGPGRHSSQNHYCATAAEIYALHGRLEDAQRCVRIAGEILDRYPGGFNDVNHRWALAVVAAALDDGSDDAVALLEDAAEAARARNHLPILCKAHALLASRHASRGRFQDAHRHQLLHFEAHDRRMTHRASVKYYQLKVEHELARVRAERDRAERQRLETEALARRLELLNRELSRHVAEVEELRARLAAEAIRDPLTRLFNRRHLDAVVPGLLAAADRRAAPLAVVLIDLDHFKRVNDRHGHLAGDRMLEAIGALLPSALRPSDVVCRYGGEEFCIVMPDTDSAGARAALDHVAGKLRELDVAWEGEALAGQTFSGGIAELGPGFDTFDQLLSGADRALYAAKASGRGRVLFARDVPLSA